MTRLTKARLGYALGLLAAAVGFGMSLGAGWGLWFGGMTAAGSFLLLAEIDDEESDQ